VVAVTAPQRRIVIADDDDDLRDLLREAFAGEGYLVEEAMNGAELRGMLEQAQRADTLPHLVLSDYRMPSITGLEVLSWVAESVPALPFILFSAFAAPDVRKRALELGAVAVLEKPVDMRVLKQKVADVLARN
jgi:CheY-like chemotaxis protein